MKSFQHFFKPFSVFNSSPDTSRSRSSNDTIISPIVKNRPNSTFQPIPIKPQKLLKTSNADDSAISSAPDTSKQLKDEMNQLGRLDGLISNPGSKLNKVRVPDSRKIAAILLETNIVELQRHLLTITVQNQVSWSLTRTESKTCATQKMHKLISLSDFVKVAPPAWSWRKVEVTQKNSILKWKSTRFLLSLTRHRTVF